mgnify:CR=1 FL=1
MEFRLDKSLRNLRIQSIVIAIAKNVSPHAGLSPPFLKKKKEMEKDLIESMPNVEFEKAVITFEEGHMVVQSA